MSEETVFDGEFFTQSFPECKNDVFAPCANIFSNVLSPEIPSRLMEVFTPVIFRKQYSFHSPHRLVKTQQQCAPQRLINLSFSQPSTPKTPAFTGLNKPTPFRSTFETMMLTTPMLIRTLDNLQQQTRTGSQSPYPDILQLIDDDSCSGTALDQQLGCNETHLSDSNIVDYLLDLSQDVKHQILCNQTTLTTSGFQLQTAYHSPPTVVHRTRRKTKLMTEEERQSLQRIQREKQKQRRKTTFRTPRSGTRKSKRVRRQVVKYC